MGKEFFAFATIAATAFITAGIVYQVVKPGSQGPQVIKTVGATVTSLSADLFKG